MPTRAQAEQFANNVIEPALQQIGLFNAAAAQLLLGTAIHESKLTARRQLGGGPARGLFQMEPATHDDIWNNYLKYNQNLANLVRSLKSSPAAKGSAELESNDKYAAAMARVHYKRAPAALPKAGDLQGMASYWKLYYNTLLGAGTTKQYVDDWKAVFG